MCCTCSNWNVWINVLPFNGIYTFAATYKPQIIFVRPLWALSWFWITVAYRYHFDLIHKKEVSSQQYPFLLFSFTSSSSVFYITWLHYKTRIIINRKPQRCRLFRIRFRVNTLNKDIVRHLKTSSLHAMPSRIKVTNSNEIMASFNRAKMCVIYSPGFSRAKQIIFYNACIESSFTYVIYMITCANWFRQRATYLRSQKRKRKTLFESSFLLYYLKNVLQECLLFVCKTQIDLSLREIILAFDIKFFDVEDDAEKNVASLGRPRKGLQCRNCNYKWGNFFPSSLIDDDCCWLRHSWTWYAESEIVLVRGRAVEKNAD